MTRRRDVAYNFKQIATHMDYVHDMALRGEITYSQTDQQMYIDILTEYFEIFRTVFISDAVSSETVESGSGSGSGSGSNATNGSNDSNDSFTNSPTPPTPPTPTTTYS